MDIQRRNLFRGRGASSLEVARLPWLKSHELFYESCTRCDKCIQNCPESIILKADGGFPAVDFSLGECTFCGKCAEICPQALFNIDTDENQKPWPLIAQVDQSLCLSYQQVSCQSCQDSCSFNAINFTLQIGKTPYPEVKENLCTGCGACVSRCPSYAIKVITNE